MRKQEYLHVHALLLEVAVQLADDGAISTQVVDHHDGRAVGPNAVHAAKSDHHAAVMALSASLATAIEESPAEPAQPPAQ